MEERNMIELKSVNKFFNDRKVLDNVSFKVEKGETFVIIGLSGTGKTVTLRHIAGLVDPSSGEVLIDSVQMNGADKRTREKLRDRMGVLFQSGALLNWLNIEENIALPLVERKLAGTTEIEQNVKEKLRILQLSDASKKMPAEISGGMKKRAGLARALVTNPEIILYDEPTSGLDPVMSSLINRLIIKLQKEFNVTSVVVTHDMNSAYEIADRIAMLYNGRIVQCDTPENIKNTDNPIVRQFIEGSLQGPITIE
jgi:phospholipid/cholesterol/gamma-HCH transport system ATP-binding protein